MSSMSAQQKKELIKRAYKGEKVAKLCREAGVARKTFYQWLKKYQGSKPHLTHLALTDHRLKKKIAFTVTTVAQKKMLFQEANKGSMSIADLCQKYGLSRKTYYKWFARYKNRNEPGLMDLRPRGAAHPRAIPLEHKEKLLAFVASNPDLSVHQLAKQIDYMGHHAIQNTLEAYNLNTISDRSIYASKFAPSIEPELPAATIDSVSVPSLDQLSPNVLPGPPPPSAAIASTKPILPSPKASLGLKPKTVFFISILASFVLSVSTINFISSLTSVNSSVEFIARLFALLALALGTIFFFYSIKYYISVALVLLFSRKVNNVDSKGQFDFQSGQLSANNNQLLSGFRDKTGLIPNLANVTLDRYPFVSIHIPLYNEKRVVNRLLEAVTSMEYEHYEVVVCDDSTDETKDIVAEWKNHPKVKISHRDNRVGFKGAALEAGRKLMNPATEFVIVFDADFLPYPDTIQQFLKYFKAATGTLENPMSKVKVQMSNEGTNNLSPLTYASSNIAAIQGYQWPASAEASAGKHVSSYTDSNIAAIQGYQWHVLNKSENWITRGVRTEYAGSYVIERSGGEVYGGLKQIAGSVFMIRADVLNTFGWGSSITEDFQLTLRLYKEGFKVLYTPYIQAPSECVSTLKRLVRQRMRWAEGHSHNIKLLFKDVFLSQNTSAAEKFEFGYLAPYYLQSAFFLLGTFAWFTSETIFKVKLPFWTAVWGWSLVLTNLLSLPLMNTVGLFLEESEEKDYVGILSFILLSYILAPFQAYASVKGFLEREEGPWFRTPKTGKITDTYRRGRFYDWIKGLFGAKTAVEVEMPLRKNYLYLPNVSTPGHEHRKKHRWLGKSLLSLMILMALFLNIFSVGQNYPGVASKMRLSGRSLLIDTKNTFNQGQQPEFTIRLPEEQKEPLAFLDKFFQRDVQAAEPEITTKVYDPSGGLVERMKPEVVRDGSKAHVTLPTQSEFKPGKYTLSAEWRQGTKVYQSSQDFRWGVLAINTKKSIYKPGETVQFGFGTIDDTGKTICNANLDLEITQPDKTVKKLTTDNHTIDQSGYCHATSVTNMADYLGSFTATEAGIYQLFLKAETENGKRTITDQFAVREEKDIPFEIERTSYPTRIYPPTPYPVTITIKANQDFNGTIIDSVPNSFELSACHAELISPSQDSQILKQVQDDRNCLISSSNQLKTISWNVEWKAGETHRLTYTIQFPRESPEYYLVGPLRLVDTHSGQALIMDSRLRGNDKAGLGSGEEQKIFQESRSNSAGSFAETRQWQIAADVVATKFMESGTDATGGFEFWTSNTSCTSYATDKKTGPNSIKCTSDLLGNPSYVTQGGVLSTTNGTGSRVSLYVNFQNLPTTNAIFINMSGSIIYVQVTSAGVLQLYNTTTKIGLDGSTLVAGNWYRITLAYNIIDSTHIDVKVFFNGNQDISASNQAITGTFSSNINLGWVSSAAGNSKTVLLDDIYIDNSNAVTDTGDVRVTAKLPATVNNNNFDTNHAVTNVNQRPLNTGNFDQHAGTSQVQQDYTLQDAATGDVNISGNTLVARTAWVYAKRGEVANRFVQTVATPSNKSAGTTLSFAPAVTTTAGDTIIIAFAMDNDSTADPGGTVSAADDASPPNTYSIAVQKSGGGTAGTTARTVIFYALNATALTGANTITITHPSVTARAAVVAEFSGIATSGAVDKTLCGLDAAKAPSSGATATTTQNDEVIFGALGIEDDSGAWSSIGIGMTPDQAYISIAKTSGGGAASNMMVNAQYAIQTATSVQTADGSLSLNRESTSCITTFLAATNGTSLGTPGIVDNGSVTGQALTTTDALYALITDSATYPTNLAGIGMRSSNATPDTFFYEGGTLIAFIGAPVPEAALLAIPAAAFAPKILQSIKAGAFRQDTLALIEKILLFIQNLVMGLVTALKKKIFRLAIRINSWFKQIRQRY